MYCFNCVNDIPEETQICPCCGYSMDTETPPHHIMAGSYLQDRYYVGNAIGEGGFGITYIGRDTNLDVRVAIKEFFPNGYSTRNNLTGASVSILTRSANFDYESNMTRFLNEARALAKFSVEPGIVGVKDFFRANGTAYIIMEYLDGVTFKTYLKNNGKFEADDLVKKIAPVIKSLDKVHQEGLIHRDISPDNIMILKNGNVKLLDFGAARNYSDDNKSLSIMLKQGYAPEEQYRTKGDQGPWTDVYALCATMYKCLSGVTPEESVQRAFEKVDMLKPLHEIGVQVSERLENAIMKGLAIHKQDRFQNMSELYDAIFGEKKNSNAEGEAVNNPAIATIKLKEDEEATSILPENSIKGAYNLDGSAKKLEFKQAVPNKEKQNKFFFKAGDLDELTNINMNIPINIVEPKEKNSYARKSSAPMQMPPQQMGQGIPYQQMPPQQMGQGIPYQQMPPQQMGQGMPYQQMPSQMSQGMPYQQVPQQMSPGMPYQQKPQQMGQGMPYQQMPSQMSPGMPYQQKPQQMGPGMPYQQMPSQMRQGMPYQQTPQQSVMNDVTDESTVVLRVCPKCGMQVEPGGTFCGYCGQKI